MSGSGVNRLIQSDSADKGQSEEELRKRLQGNATEDALKTTMGSAMKSVTGKKSEKK